MKKRIVNGVLIEQREGSSRWRAVLSSGQPVYLIPQEGGGFVARFANPETGPTGPNFSIMEDVIAWARSRGHRFAPLLPNAVARRTTQDGQEGWVINRSDPESTFVAFVPARGRHVTASDLLRRRDLYVTDLSVHKARVEVLYIG